MGNVFASLWPFRRDPNRALASRLLEAVVAASREPALYGPERILDTFEGRLEAAMVFAALAQIRLAREPEARPLAQAFSDALFRWFDSGLYEAGIGYQNVPKRIRAMGERFYGRVQAYAGGVEAGDENGLAEALARNIARAAPADWPFAPVLARHALHVAAAQANLPVTGLAEASAWPSFS